MAKKESSKPRRKKKRSMFKTLLTLFLLLIIIGAIANFINPTEETKQPETESVMEETEVDTSDLSREEQIQNGITKRIESEYENTDIDHITINQNLGTDNPDDYIALVDVTWNVKNSEKTTKEMLKMYSDDLAATVANDFEDVQEIALFWTVPYIGKDAKYSYERKDGKMYVMDEAIGF